MDGYTVTETGNVAMPGARRTRKVEEKAISRVITSEEAKEFHRLYEQYDAYAEVGRRMERSGLTVAK